MAFELPPLPYDYKALEPYMSAQTLEFHHDKHHAGYVNNLNNMVKDTELADKTLEEVVVATFKDSGKVGIFNNAAQIWNHNFYWNSMKPSGGGEPTGAIAEKINAAFGGYDKFKEAFKSAGVTQFGSGWAWLVLENGELKITKTLNAENPLVYNQVPLLTMDVWEHAYYLDYQNQRPAFADAFIANLINWDFVNENLAAAA
ncbi:MAG: superoxide dismutase [Leptolyngbyaceae cyanobacterium bins.59]|nr:superoxide dismutase [Leptolyngbyaceae cyanobacterium bins.59]